MAFRSPSERKKQIVERPDPGPKPVTSIADAALNDFAQAAQTRLRASAVAIAIEFGGQMTCRARAGASAPDIGTPVQRDRGITGECVSTGAVLRCDDTRSDPRVDAAVCEQLGIRSILLVPLLFQGKVIGVVEAFFPVRYGFDDAAVFDLQETAKQIVSRVCGEDEPQVDDVTSTAAIASPDPQLEPAAAGVTEGVAEAAPEFHLEEDSPLRVVTVSVVIVVLALAAILYAYYNNADHLRRQSTAAAEAVSKLRRAAESGDATAQFKLAQAYKTGTGVVSDPQQANAWLLTAAEHGNADAQFEWARAVEDHDPLQAYTWYVIAGQSGKTESNEAIRRLAPGFSLSEIAQVRFDMAQKILEGHALPRDPVAAYMWFALSEWGGNPNARKSMRQLGSQLTPAELRDAKSRASAWIRQHRSTAAQKENPSAIPGR